MKMEVEMQEIQGSPVVCHDENRKPSHLAQRDMEVMDKTLNKDTMDQESEQQDGEEGSAHLESTEIRNEDLHEDQEETIVDSEGGEEKGDVPEILKDLDLAEFTSDEIFAVAGLKDLRNQGERSPSSSESSPESHYKSLIAEHDHFETALLKKIDVLESRLKTSEGIVRRAKIRFVRGRRHFLQMQNSKLRRQRKSDVVRIQNLKSLSESLQETLETCHSQLEFTEAEYESELDSLTLAKNLEIRKLMVENLKLQDGLGVKERQADQLRNRVFHVKIENWHLKTKNQKLDEERMQRFRDYQEFQGYRDEKVESLEELNCLNTERIQHLEQLLKLQDDDLHAKNETLKDLRLEHWKLQNRVNVQKASSRHLKKNPAELERFWSCC